MLIDVAASGLFALRTDRGEIRADLVVAGSGSCRTTPRGGGRPGRGGRDRRGRDAADGRPRLFAAGDVAASRARPRTVDPRRARGQREPHGDGRPAARWPVRTPSTGTCRSSTRTSSTSGTRRSASSIRGSSSWPTGRSRSARGRLLPRGRPRAGRPGVGGLRQDGRGTGAHRRGGPARSGRAAREDLVGGRALIRSFAFGERAVAAPVAASVPARRRLRTTCIASHRRPVDEEVL